MLHTISYDCGVATLLGSLTGAVLIYVLSALVCFGVARLLSVPSPHEPDGSRAPGSCRLLSAESKSSY